MTFSNAKNKIHKIMKESNYTEIVTKNFFYIYDIVM